MKGLRIETQVKIYASPSMVWDTLMDFERYPLWNPFIRSIKGIPYEGYRLKVRIAIPDNDTMTFAPTVIRTESQKEFRWQGRLFIKGLFDGEHYFVLEKLDDYTTLLIHGESFSGILTRLMSSLLHRTAIGFEMMNLSLKKHCESQIEWE